MDSGRSVLLRPSSGPGHFQRTIASMQGKIPSPRVQVSKELLGPLFSLEWALRSRRSCPACFPPRCVFLLTPELPRIVLPQPWPGNGEGEEMRLCSLRKTNWERQECGQLSPSRAWGSHPRTHTFPPTRAQGAGRGGARLRPRASREAGIAPRLHRDTRAIFSGSVGMLGTANVCPSPFEAPSPAPAFLPLLFLPRSAQGTQEGE